MDCRQIWWLSRFLLQCCSFVSEIAHQSLGQQLRFPLFSSKHYGDRGVRDLADFYGPEDFLTKVVP